MIISHWTPTGDVSHVAAMPRKGNAALIVELVNNAEALVEEIERLRAALKPMTEGTHWITDADVETACAALEQKQ